MATNWYLKELLSTPVIVRGKSVTFEPLPGNRGLLALDSHNESERQLAEDLNRLADEQVGGVVKISQAEYEDKKKAVLLTPSDKKPEMLRVNPQTPFPLTKSATAALAEGANIASQPAPSGPTTPTAFPGPSGQDSAPDPSAPPAPPVPPSDNGFRPPVRRGRPPKSATAAAAQAPAATPDAQVPQQ